MAQARVVLDQTAIDAMAADPQIVASLLEAAKPVVEDARINAPRLTGAGADSITAQPYPEPAEQTVRISWDREHFYMGFHELGTVQLPARHFLQDALEANLI